MKYINTATAAEIISDKLNIPLSDLRDIVAEIPSEDVQPVKHGKWVEREITRMKWIPNDDDNVNPDDVEPERMTEQKCSYCNRWTIKFTDHIELNYCPLCGAKMDGDSE